MPKTITLYHGTIYDFDEIDIARGKPQKDFGQGFYTTQAKSQSVNMANRNYDIEVRRYSLVRLPVKNLQKYLYTYDFSLESLNCLHVKRFEKADSEWLNFVTANRNSTSKTHTYDIVIGATANDRTNASIQLYFGGAYGTVGSVEAIEILLKILMPDKLPMQYFFGTKEAIKFLNLKNKEVLPCN